MHNLQCALNGALIFCHLFLGKTIKDKTMLQQTLSH